MEKRVDEASLGLPVEETAEAEAAAVEETAEADVE